MELGLFFVREKVKKQLYVQHFPADLQVVDALTKPLSTQIWYSKVQINVVYG